MTDEVALITGSTRGLGLAYAGALLERGMKVVLNGRPGGEAPALSHRDRWTYVPADVGCPEAAAELVEAAVERFGRVDVLVNNAGRYRDRSLLKMSDEEFDEVVKSHLYASFYCGRAVARVMREGGGGRIVNISSDAATGAFGQSNYSAAKAGIVALTMTWAIELARYEIVVNAVLPNAATEPVLSVPGLAERWGYQGGFPRSMGKPEEAAPLVAYLASSESAGRLTGQIFSLGGDRLAVWQWLREGLVAFKEGGWTYLDLDRLLMTFAERSLNQPGFQP